MPHAMHVWFLYRNLCWNHVAFACWFYQRQHYYHHVHVPCLAENSPSVTWPLHDGFSKDISTAIMYIGHGLQKADITWPLHDFFSEDTTSVTHLLHGPWFAENCAGITWPLHDFLAKTPPVSCTWAVVCLKSISCFNTLNVKNTVVEYSSSMGRFFIHSWQIGVVISFADEARRDETRAVKVNVKMLKMLIC